MGVKFNVLAAAAALFIVPSFVTLVYMSKQFLRSFFFACTGGCFLNVFIKSIKYFNVGTETPCLA